MRKGRRFLVVFSMTTALILSLVVFHWVGHNQPSAMASNMSDNEDIVQTLARERSEHHGLIRAHEREDVDGAWSAKTRAILVADLNTLSKSIGFNVESIDCRTRTCVAAVSFRSFVEAKTKWAAIVSRPNHARCTTRATLDEPATPEGSFQLQVLYGCR
jgi:hypothetical protein